MGVIFVINLDGNIYSCKHCNTHLAIADDIISKAFHCKHGRAYLFDKVVNVTCGSMEERLMMTGWHTVVDIFCVRCGSIVGWKYVEASEKIQKYKEGKFILERFKVLGPDGSSYQMNLIPILDPNLVPNPNQNQNQDHDEMEEEEDEDDDDDVVDGDDDQMA